MALQVYDEFLRQINNKFKNCFSFLSEILYTYLLILWKYVQVLQKKLSCSFVRLDTMVRGKTHNWQSEFRTSYVSKKKPNIFSICMSVPYSTKTRLVPYSANIFFFLDSGILNFDYRFFLCLPLFTIYKENIFTRFGYQFKKKIVYWPCVSNQPIGYRDIVVVDLKNIILKKPP